MGNAGFRGAVLAEVEPLSGTPLNDHWLAAQQRKDYDLAGLNHRTLEYPPPWVSRKIIMWVSQYVLRLIQRKIFQIIGLIRLRAVDDFIFGFVRRFDNGDSGQHSPRRHLGNGCYLVCQFSQPRNVIDPWCTAMNTMLAAFEVGVFFSGLTEAQLVLNRSWHPVSSNFCMDASFVFETAKVDNFERLLVSTKVQNCLKKTTRNNFYYFKREV